MKFNFFRLLPALLLVGLVNVGSLIHAQPSPGGIGTTNLNLWLKADAIGAADGASINSWPASAGGYNLTKTKPSGIVRYYTTNPAYFINYNPSVYFNGTSDLSNLTRLHPNNAPYNYIVAGTDMRNPADRTRQAIAGFGSNSPTSTLNFLSIETAQVNSNLNNYSPYFGWSGGQWNSSKSIMYNGSYPGSKQQPIIYMLSSVNSGGGQIFSSIDNFQEATGRTSTPSQTEGGNSMAVGGSVNDLWIGTVNEAIVYSRVLTAAELLHINSYLALKYGTTLRSTSSTAGFSNYESTNGTVTWNITTNAGFLNNVAGIGRDDNTALNQKQSRSVNDNTDPSNPMSNGNMLAVGLGSITASNTTNPNTFAADNTFVIWGDNGLTGKQTTQVPSSTTLYGVPGLNVQRARKVWKVQTTGTPPTTLQLKFFLATSGLPIANLSSFKLLVNNTSSNFTTADAVYNAATFDNVTRTVTFNNITLTNGQYFTIVTQANPTPGGVGTSLVTWLRADDPTITLADGATIPANTVTSQPTSGTVYWPDYVGGLPLYSGTGIKLFYKTNPGRQVNFNPSFWFTGDSLGNGGTGLANANRFFPSDSAFEEIAVGRDEASNANNGHSLRTVFGIGSNNQPQFGLDATTNGSEYWINGSNPNVYQTSRSVIYNQGSHNILGKVPQIYGTNSSNLSTSATDNVFQTIDNFNEQTTMDAQRFNTIGGQLYVGAAVNAWTWTGSINEMIIYRRQLSAIERLRVNSYLAIKYGITMREAITIPTTSALVRTDVNNYTKITYTPTNYLRADSTIIWDATRNSAYKYNIAGIGKDDRSDLNQKQSRSQNNLTGIPTFTNPAVDNMYKGNMLTIGLGTIANSNLENVNEFENDGDFTVWSDNGLNPVEVLNSADLPFQFSVCPGSKRLAREWKVQVTGAVNTNLSLQFNLTGITGVTSTAADQVRLLVDEDGNGNFTDGTIRVYPASSVTGSPINGVTFNNVTLKDGEVFTLLTLAVEDGIPFLVPSGSAVLNDKIIKCAGLNGYRYFYDPVATNPTHKIFALNPMGNAVNISTTPASNSFTVSVDANRTQAELEEVNAVSAIVLANRLVQVTTTAPQPFTLNGGVRVRIYKDQAELNATADRLAQLQTANNISGNVATGWFKFEGTIAQLLTGLTPLGLTGTFTYLTPDSTGVEEGVEFVEFWNIKNFSTFGYRAQVPGNLDVSGTVWADANGNGIHEPSELLLTGGSDLFVALVDPGTGNVIGEAKVDAATGTYTIPGAIVAGTGPYTLRMTTTEPVVGSTPPAINLPSGYARTGELISGTNDGGTPSEITIAQSATSTLSLSGYDFGIDRVPLTDAKLFTDVPNSQFTNTSLPGFLGIAMSSTSLTPLSGTDAEDCPTAGGCTTGKSFVIQSISAGTRLFYNGTEITGTGVAGDTVNNFDPSLLVIYSAIGSTTQSFTYSLIDAARKVSLISATYTINPLFPLPVVLIRFDVTQQGKSALLTWRTASEQNSNRFEIESSINGNAFSKIGEVRAIGNSNTTNDYSYTDQNISRYGVDRIYYRLKQIDIDGRFKYSEVRLLHLGGRSTDVKVSPVPFRAILIVQLPEGWSGATEIRLVDMLGRVVYQQNENISGIQSNIVLSDLSTLAAGSYVLTLKNNRDMKNMKVVKE